MQFIAIPLGLLVIVFFLVVFLASRYKRCPSDRILVVYGRVGTGRSSRCIHGGGTMVWPVIQSYAFLDLTPMTISIPLQNALSLQNIRISVPSTFTVGVSTEPAITNNAAERLLHLGPQTIEQMAGEIIIGQLRLTVASLTIEQINQDRESFLASIRKNVESELNKIGLYLINVNITDITDSSDYIESIGKKAASEAINKARIDVAEQDKLGASGVAERERDQRVSVAAANADAEIGEAEAMKKKRQLVAGANSEAQIGEATADRNRRQQMAALDAEAVNAETEAGAKKAAYQANQKVAEEEARKRGESVAQEADGAIRVAQETAQKKAEDARALRETSRLNAEVVVPADATRKQVVIAAEAEKQQAVLHAQGQAEATLARMRAEGEGTQAVLDGKATGYRNLVQASGDAQAAAALLLIEKFADLAGIQAKAIANLPIEKIIVWDGGGEDGGMSSLGKKVMGALPPMHELARQVGLDLPEFLGRVAAEQEKTGATKTAAASEPAKVATPKKPQE